jgi:transposase
MGMDIAVVLGVDLGKNVCSVVGLDASGAVVMGRKVRRETLIRLSETLPPCIVGMEACCGAHHLGRLFAAHGHDVRLMSPEYVVAPQGKRKLEQFLAVLMDEQAGAGLSPRMILLVADARAQWTELDRRIAAFDGEFVRWARENEDARRLVTIPGFGAIIASALVASVGRAEAFDRARDLSAWLGIASAIHHRRQTEAARHQQARQQIPSPPADPWSARGAALCR